MPTAIDPLQRYLSALTVYVGIYVTILLCLMGWSSMPNAMESYLIATKMWHLVVIVVAIVYIRGVRDQDMEQSALRKVADATRTVYAWYIVLCIAAAITDAIIVGAVHFPALSSCFAGTLVPTPDGVSCESAGLRAAYLLTVILQILHVVVGILMMVWGGFVQSQMPRRQSSSSTAPQSARPSTDEPPSDIDDQDARSFGVQDQSAATALAQQVALHSRV
jgi:hypothetical protein